MQVTSNVGDDAVLIAVAPMPQSPGPRASFTQTDTAPMKTLASTKGLDATTLTDDQLRLLESTLRVQLEMNGYANGTQATSIVGVAVLTGGLSLITSGAGIAYTAVQRRKCRKRLRAVYMEMARRGLVPYRGIREARLGQRAWGIACGVGFINCMLAFAMDVLVDRAVLQVVSEFISMGFGDQIFSRFEDHVSMERTGKSMTEVRQASADLMAGTETTPNNQQQQHHQLCCYDDTNPAKRSSHPGGTLKKALTWSGVETAWRSTKKRWRGPRDRSRSLPPRELNDDGPESLFGRGKPQTHEDGQESNNSPESLFGRVEPETREDTQESNDSPVALFGSVEVRRTNMFPFFGECFQLHVLSQGHKSVMHQHRSSHHPFQEYLDEEEGNQCQEPLSPLLPMQGRRIGPVHIVGDSGFNQDQWYQLWKEDDEDREHPFDFEENEDENEDWEFCEMFTVEPVRPPDPAMEVVEIGKCVNAVEIGEGVNDMEVAEGVEVGQGVDIAEVVEIVEIGEVVEGQELYYEEIEMGLEVLEEEPLFPTSHTTLLKHKGAVNGLVWS